MIRKTLTAALLVVALAPIGSAMAGSVTVCDGLGKGPGNGGSLKVEEGGVSVTWAGDSGGSGGTNNCVTVNNP